MELKLCEVTLRFKVSGDKYKYLAKAYKELEKAGFKFTTSMRTEDNTTIATWELNHAIIGDLRVIFNNFK
jgi:hypothetical protein